MGFSATIKEDILVASARHCCVCHRYRGLNIEIHHITPKEQGGKDSFENAIALCFDCHSDAGHYFAKHPKGTKLSPKELKKHKEEWFNNVKRNNIKASPDLQVELVISEEEKDPVLKPVFIKETTVYKDVNDLRKIDFKKFVEDNKTGDMSFDFLLRKIKTFEDFVDFMNGDSLKKYDKKDIEKETSPQPINFSMGHLGRGFTKTTNLSTCSLNLKLVNNGPNILENYKVYLSFINIIKADTVDKNQSYLDLNKYTYNTIFKDDFNAEFLPKDSVLVQSDSVNLDTICFKPKAIPHEIVINWKLLAQDFQQNGQLAIKVLPEIEEEENIKYVENPKNHKDSFEILNKYEF